MKHLRCFFLVRPIALWAFRSLKMAWLEFASSLPGQYMAVDSDKYYPRDINAAARENSRGGRPRETFRPAKLFLRPRETFSGHK